VRCLASFDVLWQLRNVPARAEQQKQQLQPPQWLLFDRGTGAGVGLGCDDKRRTHFVPA
jgi:hypothetical protein